MRIGKAERNTKETQISLSWNLDGADPIKEAAEDFLTI